MHGACQTARLGRSAEGTSLAEQLRARQIASHPCNFGLQIAFKLRSLLENDPRPFSWSIFAMLQRGLAQDSPGESKQTYTLARALLRSPAAQSSSSPSHIWLKVSILLALAAVLVDDDETRIDVLREAWDFLESDEGKRMGGGNLEIDLVRWEVVEALGRLDVDVWLSEWAALRSRIAGREGTPP